VIGGAPARNPHFFGLFCGFSLAFHVFVGYSAVRCAARSVEGEKNRAARRGGKGTFFNHT